MKTFLTQICLTKKGVSYTQKLLGGQALRGAVVLALLSAAAASAPALAQDSGGSSEGSTSGGLSGQLEASAQLSPKEKREFSHNALVEMQNALMTVDKYLEQAEREQDEDRIQCVRLNQASIKAPADVSERADAAMREALAQGSEQRAEHKFRKIAVALSKVRQFVAEAEACIGQGGVAAGATQVDVTDEGITEEDPTDATVHSAAASSAVFGAPKGCPKGAVCFYKSGNGGDLCDIWYGDAPTLGACANIGPSGSIYNNGEPCVGCQDVNLYFGRNYQGAYYCLPRGNYLLFIDKDRFNRGEGLPGYGQTLGYRPGLPNGPGGVASAKWTRCN